MAKKRLSSSKTAQKRGYERFAIRQICPHPAVFICMENAFGITETGEVYRRDPQDWVLLGTLPCVLHDPSIMGLAVRNWWKSLVESDRPLPFLILRSSKLRGPRIPNSEAMMISGLEVGVLTERE